MGLFAGGLFASTQGSGAVASKYDIYVDSVFGDDTKDGTTVATASASLAAAQAAAEILGAGAKIGLARGSHFREKLTITHDRVTVGAYGVGERPIVDGSDIVLPTAWTKTAGRTHVYQCTLTVETDDRAEEQPNLWIDGAYAVIVADLVTCDATPGSIYFADVSTTTLTLYLHSTGSTDPTSDGKRYEAAVRVTGIDTYDSDSAIIRDIHGCKNYCSYGSLIVGRFCQAVRCLVREGNTHNMYLRGGAKAIDCIAEEFYHPIIEPIAFVAYDSMPSALPVEYVRCVVTVSETISIARGIGFYNHSPTGFGEIKYKDCEAHNLGTAFAIADAEKMILSGCKVSRCLYPLETVGVDISCASMVVRKTRFSGYWGNFSGENVRVTLTGCDAEFDTTGNFRALAAGQVLTMENTRIAGANTILRANISGTKFVVNDNRFEPAIPGGSERMSSVYDFPQPTILQSDRNDFGGATGEFLFSGNTYTSPTDWIANSGQDIHSVA